MEPGITQEEELEEEIAEIGVPDISVDAQEKKNLAEGSCSSMNPCDECFGVSTK